METSGMPGDFSFAGGMRAPWYTSPEEIALTAAADDFSRSEWNDWMQWDPHAPQTTDVKPPLNAQGPICYIKGAQKPTLYHRRQNSQLRDPALGLMINDPASRPIQDGINGNAYMFGENADQHQSFQFDSGTGSLSPHGDSQQNGFYAWGQQQGGSEITTFSPVTLEHQDRPSNDRAPPSSTPSLNHSPNSINHTRTSSSSLQSSPEPERTINPKKRKSASVDDGDSSETKKDKPPPVKKTAHNMIEKRYRTNLNDKIAALRDSVPSLRIISRGDGNGEDDDGEDLEGLTPAHKLNKATVLSKATEYIRHLEKRNKHLQKDVDNLKARLEHFEKMSMSGPMAMVGAMKTPDTHPFSDDPFAGNPMVNPSVSGPPQGMIPVPESMANLHRGLPPQQHYAPPSGYGMYTGPPARPNNMPGPPMVSGHGGNRYAQKLMVGALAGLMVVGGLETREQSGEEPEGRGLFALPFHLVDFAKFLTKVTPRVSVGGVSTHISLANLLFVSAALYWILSPFMSARPRPRGKSATALLSPAPSLASPVEVRRKAWLTAIQTVWVPRHNFMLELAALVLKSLKLSTRKIIGWPGYAFLTGTTKEQEVARVKAWDIAVDAQLTGGDAEISKSRLVLTLMASGTLPDTPARLMLKALHIRVLLWEVSHAGYGSQYIFAELSAKLARRFWNAARAEQKIAANTSSRPDTDAEQLPDHLVALLEMECDDVLTDVIVHRAYNLAWNRPSSQDTNLDASMDSVVEDFAISSPLDALAAWWSSFVLNQILLQYLDRRDSDLPEGIKNDLNLATRTAPQASQAQLRAFVAKAVLLDEERSSHIDAAFQALPSPISHKDGSSRALMNPVGTCTVSDDINQALTLAKCLSLVESTNSQARRRAIVAINNIYLPVATMTLLSCVAAYKIIDHLLDDPALRTETGRGLERLVSAVRMWVGYEAGRLSGLSNKARARVVKYCLDVSKKLVGLAQFEESDAGYVSQSDATDADG